MKFCTVLAVIVALLSISETSQGLKFSCPLLKCK